MSQTASAADAGGFSPNRTGQLFLARHGRTLLNAENRLRGHLDPELDATGLAEADSLAAVLSALPVLRVVSSPLRRAMQTAGAIARPRGLAVLEDADLIDRDYGTWAGATPDSVIQQWGSLEDAPGVEAAAAVVTRARAALARQVPYVGEGVVVLVAHDAVNRLLLHDLDPGLGPVELIPQGTACWNLLHWRRPSWKIDSVGQQAP